MTSNLFLKKPWHLVLFFLSFSSLLYAQNDCTAIGGEISLENGETNKGFCLSNDSEEIVTAKLKGAEGSRSAWLVTDFAGNILDISSKPTFQISKYQQEIIEIRHLSFEDGIKGLTEGGKLQKLEGCFDASNSLRLFLRIIEGSILKTGGGLEEKTICYPGGSRNEVYVEGEGGTGSRAMWLITDLDSTILEMPNNPPFSLEELEQDTLLIWDLSYEELLVEVKIGGQLQDLAGCYGLSKPLRLIRDRSGECRIACLPPIYSSAVSLSKTSALIEWPDIPESYIYVVRYRPVGSSEWNYASVYKSRRELKYLQPGTLYEYQIQTLCLPENSEQGAINTFSTPLFSRDVPVELQVRIDLINQEALSMKVHPNPTRSNLQIDYKLGSDIGQLTIAHISGQKVFETQLTVPKDVLELDLGEVPSGYYVVSLNDGKEIITKKLIKTGN